MKKPVLVSLVLFNHPLKALILEASITEEVTKFDEAVSIIGNFQRSASLAWLNRGRWLDPSDNLRQLAHCPVITLYAVIVTENQQYIVIGRELFTSCDCKLQFYNNNWSTRKKLCVHHCCLFLELSEFINN